MFPDVFINNYRNKNIIYRVCIPILLHLGSSDIKIINNMALSNKLNCNYNLFFNLQNEF